MMDKAYPVTRSDAEWRKLLTPEQLANPASYPTAPGKLETFRDIGKAAAAIDSLMTDLKSAQ